MVGPRARDETRRGDPVERIAAFPIRRALERRGGQRTATARALGITREGIYKKMKRLTV